MAKKPKSRGYESHVRFQEHELGCAAYRSLSSDSRSLLTEFRRLYKGRENRIYMSVRQAMERMNVGQRPAQRALKELLDRGWIRVVERGSFSRKVRHATVYALTNEPLDEWDGETAPKDYMHWSPPPQKNTIAETTTHSSHNGYRKGSQKAKKQPHSSRDEYRQSEKSEFTVAETATQISYQRGA
jgi:DNA-binding transcriptional MocR family regulator